MYKIEEEPDDLIVRIATPADVKYVYPILYEMERSAKERGTGTTGAVVHLMNHHLGFRPVTYAMREVLFPI